MKKKIKIENLHQQIFKDEDIDECPHLLMKLLMSVFVKEKITLKMLYTAIEDYCLKNNPNIEKSEYYIAYNKYNVISALTKYNQITWKMFVKILEILNLSVVKIQITSFSGDGNKLKSYETEL